MGARGFERKEWLCFAVVESSGGSFEKAECSLRYCYVWEISTLYIVVYKGHEGCLAIFRCTKRTLTIVESK